MNLRKSLDTVPLSCEGLGERGVKIILYHNQIALICQLDICSGHNAIH